MARIAWKLYDPVTLETYSWSTNPNSDSSSYAYQKNLGYSSNSYFGRTVIYDTQPETKRFSYSGNLYTQQEYNDMMTWFNKPNKVVLQDDLGIRYYVYFTEFVPDRVRSRQHAWKHKYTVSGIVLNGTPPAI